MTPPTDPGILSPLGKPTECRADYAPELLYPIPRSLGRAGLAVSQSLCYNGEKPKGCDLT